ncbi:TonB-dependent hemoglobin/transferrin/lactoferrin family receptor [Kordiimonas laminariae]|uniref:TonB-dependent hemoglobin/transferrin/lactoferrin family receptor n=1 Tax=Kordiimonas laminariae TaxID=2917717 RepID=UPI001FF5C2DC|nr:TonB-dependent hemoglobin/transferrin/lactoferrin family receptor [Kordiimonas laminariae]MCK0070907.1 TonB-dependent hemoglobin/transferrin/lactoferrin family receptor [Kordiimonas laminariae]
MTVLGKYSWLAAGCSLIALTGTAAATEAEADLPEEITVTATRSATSAFEHPGSVSVITKDEIDDLVASSISDLFENTPGIFFDGGPRRNAQTPSIRGISGEGVIILFDGVRQSFISGHDGRFFIEPDLLKTAEVVRGGGSALYGSGGLGGVIAFQTIDAADLLDEDSTLGYRLKGGFQGVNNEWTKGVSLFGRSEDGKFDAVGSLTYRDSTDIDLGSGASLQSDDELASGLIKASYRFTDDLKLDFSWLSFNGDSLEPNNGQGANVGDLVDKNTTSNTYRAGLVFNPSDNDLIDAKITVFKNDVSVNEDEVDSDRVVTRDVETFGLVAENRSVWNRGQNIEFALTYGLEYYIDDQTGTDNMSTDGTRGGVPDADAKTFGSFIQAEVTVQTELGRLNFIPAIRYDNFKNSADDSSFETDDSAWSPKVALAYHPTEWMMIFSSYSESFRAPSFNEIFADGIHFQIPLGPFVTAPNFFIENQDLQPERSKTWEFGAGLSFNDAFLEGDSFAVKGTYFTSDVTNLIDLSVDVTFSPQCFVPTIPGPCTSGTSQNVNTVAADLSGVEIELTYDTARYFLTAGYSSIDGTNSITGDFVGTLTPTRFDINTGFKLPEIDSRFGMRAQLAGEHSEVNDEDQIRDSYETVDLYYVWQPKEGALKGLRVDLGVNNLFDTNFERVFAGVSEPGRNFKALVSWTGSF